MTTPPLDTAPPMAPTAGSLPLAVATAGLVSLFLIWSGSERSLPTLGWAAAFLFLVVEEDVRRLRIPNVVTFTGLALALIHAAWLGGVHEIGQALAGAGVAFAILFVPFAARWMGAGDVKAVMVLGALWGATVVAGVVFWMLVVGGVLGVGFLAIRGGLPDLLRRWGHTMTLLVTTQRLRYVAPQPGSAAASGLPFGVAIGLGVAAYQFWGSPWA